MKETYSKNYFEKYAALTLTKVLDADIKKPLYSTLKLNPFDHDEKNLEFVINKIDNALERKEQKSKNYEIYLDNGLYIFSHCHNLPEHMLYDFLNQLNLANSFYQHIFVNCVDHLYYYRCQEQIIIKVDYSFQELSAMNQLAIDFEKHCHKERRKIELPKSNNDA